MISPVRLVLGVSALLLAVLVAVTVIGGVVSSNWDLVASGGWWWLILVFGWPVGLFAWSVWKDDGGDSWR